MNTPKVLVISDHLSLSPELVQIRHWSYLKTNLASLSLGWNHHLVGNHHRILSDSSDDMVLSVYVRVLIRDDC